jgi:hypothetical protein
VALRQESKDFHVVDDGTSASMLVEMSRIKRFRHVGISNVLRFTSICDLFTDSPSYAL